MILGRMPACVFLYLLENGGGMGIMRKNHFKKVESHSVSTFSYFPRQIPLHQLPSIK